MNGGLIITGWQREGGRERGFGVPDLVLSVGCAALLVSLVIAMMTRSRQKGDLARCTGNVGQINKAILAFAADNNKVFPGPDAQTKGDLWWFYKEQVKRYTGLTGASSPADAVFACPDDRGYTDSHPFHLTARFDFGSYVYNGVNLPAMPNIAGTSVAAIHNPTKTLLAMEWTAHAPLSWHRSRTGLANGPFYSGAESVVGFVDGHVALTKIYYDGYNAAFTRDPISGYDYQYSGE